MVENRLRAYVCAYIRRELPYSSCQPVLPSPQPQSRKRTCLRRKARNGKITYARAIFLLCFRLVCLEKQYESFQRYAKSRLSKRRGSRVEVADRRRSSEPSRSGVAFWVFWPRFCWRYNNTFDATITKLFNYWVEFVLYKHVLIFIANFLEVI